VLIAGGVAIAVTVDWLDFQHRPLAVGPEGRIYTVTPGSSAKAIADELGRLGVLDRPRYLLWLAAWKGVLGRLKAGEYRIAKGTTPVALLDQLAAGKVVQYALTLVEGWTFRQMLAAVRADPHLRHTLGSMDADALMAKLDRAGEHPEGRFFPDTYHFPKGMSDLEFLRRAYHTMERTLQREWEGRAKDCPYQSPYEALIMASLIEKESAVPAERAQIAGALVRRLRSGMLLQVDPTVIYGLGERFDGNLTRTNLRESSPYNTYVHAGLPPTPIAMPGLDALRAAMHPAPGDVLYYVARGDGSHEFSRSLLEHNRAVAKYQRQARKAIAGGVRAAGKPQP
jgi:UPF0755 protein